MRYNILKKNSTYHERVIYEILKELKIPFKHRWIIEGLEVDFLVNEKFIIEVNGHPQADSKNNLLVRLGYVPIHISNQDIINNREKIINKICLLQDSD